MIELSLSPAWVIVKHVNGDKPILPYGTVAVNSKLSKVPFTPYNIRYLFNNNNEGSIANPEVRNEWEEYYKRHDNFNLFYMMKELKGDEETAVKQIKEAFKKNDVKLWDMLRNNQIITTYLAIKNNSYGILFDMGAGKTVNALQVADIRLKKEQTPHVLIISPAPIMRPVWEEHLLMIKEKYEKKLTYEILEGSLSERVQTLEKTKADYYVLNYEMLAKMHPYLIKKGFNMMIFDESTKIKNPKAQMTRVATDLSSRIRYKLILTGTPIQTSELDIHSQMNVLQLASFFQPLPNNYYSFRLNWFFQPHNSKFAPFILRRDRKEDLNKAIYSMAIRYETSECTQLPELNVQKLLFTMNKSQQDIYNSVEHNILTEIAQHKIKAQIALTKLMKLAEITSGFVIDDKDTAVRFSTNPKLDMVEELIDEIGEKVIVFCRFKDTIKNLKERINKNYPNSVVTYYGDDSEKDKQISYTRFNKDPKARVFIAHLASGGFGLNLQHAAHHMIFCELDYLNYEQSVARIYRPGQQNKCFIYIPMAKGSIDEDMFLLKDKKHQTAESILKTIMKNKEVV